MFLSKVPGGATQRRHEDLPPATSASFEPTLEMLLSDPRRIEPSLGQARFSLLDELLAGATREDVSRLVRAMAEGAGPFELPGVAPFVRTMKPATRRALFDQALGILAPHELAAFKRLVGAQGFELLAVGDRRVTPTLGAEWPAANVTARVAELYGGRAFEKPRGAEDCTFLFGRGLFGNQVPGYLHVNRDAITTWLSDREHARLLRYDTAEDSGANAARIRQQVEAETAKGRRVVLVGHSKFGLDRLDRLVGLANDLRVVGSRRRSGGCRRAAPRRGAAAVAGARGADGRHRDVVAGR